MDRSTNCLSRLVHLVQIQLQMQLVSVNLDKNLSATTLQLSQYETKKVSKSILSQEVY